MIDPRYSLAGVLVGLVVGLTGVGGGSLMTPLLVLVFGVRPATAVGTDLLYASATKTVGTTVHGWRGTLDWRVVARLAAGKCACNDRHACSRSATRLARSIPGMPSRSSSASC